MTKYDLVEIKYRLKHCKTNAQARKVVDEYPEIRGWPLVRVAGVILAGDAVTACRTIEEQKRINALRGAAASVRRRIRMNG